MIFNQQKIKQKTTESHAILIWWLENTKDQMKFNLINLRDWSDELEDLTTRITQSHYEDHTGGFRSSNRW